jgi:hypothetical protein
LMEGVNSQWDVSSSSLFCPRIDRDNNPKRQGIFIVIFLGKRRKVLIL